MGSLDGARARRAVDWQVLLVIASAFGLGRAMESSGAAHAVAEGLLALSGSSPYGALAGVYLVTVAFTAFMTNNAAAVLMFSVALAAAEATGASPMPFVVAVMLAASNDFLTPIGYQTNTIVYGLGGYRFGDYWRLGLSLTVLVMAVVLTVVPAVWG